MSQLISKLQYRNFETDEFADEKLRTPGEVIGLMQNFPDEKITTKDPNDPAIVITGDNGNYFRIDIRGNGMVDMQYLGAGNKYYLHNSVAFEEAAEKVTQFYSGHFELTGFYKQPFDAGVKYHFLAHAAHPAEYRLRLRNVMIGCIGWIVYFLAFLILALSFVFRHIDTVVMCFIGFSLLLASMPGWVLVHVYSNYNKKRNQYLKISKGSDVFLFGNSPDQINSYRKSDVATITAFVDLNRQHSPNKFTLYEITFKDSPQITFSSALIPPGDLQREWGAPIPTNSRSPLKLTWASP